MQARAPLSESLARQRPMQAGHSIASSPLPDSRIRCSLQHLRCSRSGATSEPRPDDVCETWSALGASHVSADFLVLFVSVAACFTSACLTWMMTSHMSRSSCSELDSVAAHSQADRFTTATDPTSHPLPFTCPRRGWRRCGWWLIAGLLLECAYVARGFALA